MELPKGWSNPEPFVLRRKGRRSWGDFVELEIKVTRFGVYLNVTDHKESPQYLLDIAATIPLEIIPVLAQMIQDLPPWDIEE